MVKQNTITPVILSGGSGSRLWPLSRKDRPKQFLNLISDKTMMQETVLRFVQDSPASCSFNDPLIVCSEDHKFYAQEDIGKLDISCRILLEKYPKNTAPAIALAAHCLNGEDLMLVLPADHVISDQKEFLKAIDLAIPSANEGYIVTFGVTPTSPKTGYGYIKSSKNSLNDISPILKFIEKPDQQTANTLVKSNEYLWNSGIFLFSAQKYLEAVKNYQPNIFETTLSAMSAKEVNNNFINPDYNFMKDCPSISIDYGIMEKISNARVVRLNSKWSDIGSWQSLAETKQQKEKENIIFGDVLIHNAENNYIHTEDNLVVASNVNDLVIVNTKDALFISNKTSIDQSKSIIDLLKDNNDRNEFYENREVHRPWGKYDSIDSGNGFQVKRITVKPKQKLSVQMHHHRAEHWVVVSGIGRVHYGEKFKDLFVNDSTYHDAEVVHALENPGDEELILIEIQVGSYLGEDDIVRYEDIYGRTGK